MSYANPTTADKASVAGIENRILHALSFAKETLRLLAAEGYEDPETLPDKILPEKVIGETAFLLYAAWLTGDGIILEKVDEIARILIPYARS